MYAVIKTGGKQYRVQPGDVIVVEKLDGDAGADLSFGDVLMLGGDKGVTLGAPMIAGAAVAATLIETRKGDKIKIFKKTRRQGYRRTNGHRQMESVLRITGIEGSGEKAKWDGETSLLTKAEINARARGLAPRTQDVGVEETAVEAKPSKAEKATAPKAIDAAPAEKPAAKKAAAKKAETVEKPAADKAPAKKATAAKADKVDYVDDVSLISGIGPVLKGKLDDEGVTLAKLAKMTPKALGALDEKLELGNRWETDEWIAQAKDLVAGGAPRAKSDQARANDA